MFSFCREVCRRYIDSHPIALGGTGIICAIDESCFSHKQKYHRGRAPEREIWVFGIVDTSFKPARAYLQIVDDRTQETLLPIIHRVCRVGTTIFSDSWAAYRNIQSDVRLEHHQVNNSDTKHRFVAPDGTHTQHIESYLAKRKHRIKQMKGVRRDLLDDYLYEFMWRDIFYDNIFAHFLRCMSQQFKV